jgi:hypothetical protein
VGLGNVEGYRGEGINAFWLPQGLQNELYHPVVVSDEQKSRYACDVAFIGRDRRRGLHAGRSEVLDWVEKMDGVEHKWWGCRDQQELWGEELCAAAVCSKINLAHSGWPQISHYWLERAGLQADGCRRICAGELS